MALSKISCDTSLACQTGQDVLEKNGLVIFGMSPGNPFFKHEVVEDYVRFLGKEKRRIVVIVPQVISQHTFKAMGCKNPRKKARKQANRLRSYFKQAIEKASKSNEFVGDFYLVDWEKDVFPNKSYIASLDLLTKLYKDHPEFRYDASKTTAMVLGREYVHQSKEAFSENILSKLDRDEDAQEGVLYLIKEMAFITSSKEIFQVDSVVDMYHKPLRVLERYVNGDYDGVPKKGIGTVTVDYRKQP